MRETLIYIVNQLRYIAYEDLSKAELNILRSATKALGWSVKVDADTNSIIVTEK